MRLFLALALLAASSLANAAIKTQEIPYQSADGTRLIGYYAYDDAIQGKRPGVVVVHEWWGLNDYAKRRARLEPVVEITQIKGDSEAHPFLSPSDEFAGFGVAGWDTANLNAKQATTPDMYAGNYVREALKRVQPSAMREVMVQTPNIGWADIGGLDALHDPLAERDATRRGEFLHARHHGCIHAKVYCHQASSLVLPAPITISTALPLLQHDIPTAREIAEKQSQRYFASLPVNHPDRFCLQRE